MPRMYAGRWVKFEVTGSTRFHNTLWKNEKSVRIAPLKTLTDLYTRFLPEAQPYLTSMTGTPQSKLFIVALPKHTLS